MENQRSWLLRRWIDLRESSTLLTRGAVDKSEFVYIAGRQIKGRVRPGDVLIPKKSDSNLTIEIYRDLYVAEAGKTNSGGVKISSSSKRLWEFSYVFQCIDSLISGKSPVQGEDHGDLREWPDYWLGRV